MNTTRIVKEISQDEYYDVILWYKDKIVVSSHALDVLSLSQRRTFKPEDLISMLLNDKPSGIGLQKNGNYAVYFKTGDGFRKIIISVKSMRLEIVTFMNTDGMPNLKRI